MHGRNVTDAGREWTEMTTIRESTGVKGTVLIRMATPPNRMICL
jgi:hypothetical protein